MARTRSISSIDTEITKIEEELSKVQKSRKVLRTNYSNFRKQNRKSKPNRSWMPSEKVAKACASC